MSYVQEALAAKNPREALLILAAVLDEQERRLQQLEAKPADDGWGSWNSDPVVPRGGAVEPSPSTGGAYEAVPIQVDPEEIAQLELDYAQANDELEKNRRGGDPQRIALLAARVEGLRGRLNNARRPGAILAVSGDMVGDPDAFFTVSGGLDSLVIELPPPSAHQKKMRRELAEAINLPDFFPAVMRQTDEAKAEIIENYVKGGPYWLYAGDQEGRKMIMSMPISARQAMVMDMNEYGDVRVAHEFARDIMKSEDGVDSEFANDFIQSVADVGNPPYQGVGEN